MRFLGIVVSCAMVLTWGVLRKITFLVETGEIQGSRISFEENRVVGFPSKKTRRKVCHTDSFHFCGTSTFSPFSTHVG